MLEAKEASLASLQGLLDAQHTTQAQQQQLWDEQRAAMHAAASTTSPRAPLPFSYPTGHHNDLAAASAAVQAERMRADELAASLRALQLQVQECPPASTTSATTAAVVAQQRGALQRLQRQLEEVTAARDVAAAEAAHMRAALLQRDRQGPLALEAAMASRRAAEEEAAAAHGQLVQQEVEQAGREELMARKAAEAERVAGGLGCAPVHAPLAVCSRLPPLAVCSLGC